MDFPKQFPRFNWSVAIVLFWSLLWSAVAIGQNTIPHQGTDFWLASRNGGATFTLNPYQTLIINAQVATSGLVEIPGLAYTQAFTVTPGNATYVTLPGNATLLNSQTIEYRGIHVTSQSPITLHSTVRFDFIGAAGSALHYPIQQFDTSYIVNSFVDTTVALPNNVRPRGIVVAACDSTVIEIVPNMITAQNTQPGTPIVVTLNQGEAYHIESIFSFTVGLQDITGTTFRSLNNPPKPFGAFLSVPASYMGCQAFSDVSYEQMHGTTYWGTEFMTLPSPGTLGEFHRVFAAQNNTTVSFDGVVVATLQAGQYYDTTLTAATYITSTAPIDVLMVSKGYFCSNTTGDPEFTEILPIGEWITDFYYQSSFPLVFNPAHGLVLLSPTAQVGSVVVNGINQAANFNPIAGNPLYSLAQIPLAPGGVSVQAPGGIMGYYHELGTTNAGSSINWIGGTMLTNNPLELTLGPDTSICPGDTMVLDPGAGANNYVWSTGDTGQVLSIDTAGTFWFTATIDEISCYPTILTDTIVVDDSRPFFSLGVDTGLCSQDSFTLGVPSLPGGSFLWSGGQTTDSIAVGATGFYWAQLTDSSQCSFSDSIQLTYYTIDTVDLGVDTLVCSLDSIVLNGTTNASVSYLWSTGSTNDTLLVPGGSSVWVAVTDSNQCLSSDTIEVSLQNLPDFSLGSDTAFCVGDSLQLSGPGNMSVYQWSTGQSIPAIQVGATSTYSLAVSDSIGCSFADTLQLTVHPLPVFSLTNDTALCAGDSFTYTFPNPVWVPLWTDGTTGNSIIVNSNAGVIGASVTDNNQCVYTDSFNIQELPIPQPDLGNDTLLCQNEVLSWNVQQSGAQYLWNDGFTGSLRNVFDQGTFSVTVTSPNGCINFDSATVRRVRFDLGEDTSACSNDAVVLELPDSLGTGLWSTGDDASSTTVSNSGWVSVSVTYENCQLEDSLLVTLLPAPPPPNLIDTTVCQLDFQDGYPINAQVGSFNYLWSTGEQGAEIVATTPGIYSVTVSSGIGCSATASMAFDFDCPPGLFLPNSFTPNGDLLNDDFGAEAIGVSAYELLIFNRWGELIFRSTSLDQRWEGTHQGKASPVGVYLWLVRYELANGNGTFQQLEDRGSVTLLR